MRLQVRNGADIAHNIEDTFFARRAYCVETSQNRCVFVRASVRPSVRPSVRTVFDHFLSNRNGVI